MINGLEDLSNYLGKLSEGAEKVSKQLKDKNSVSFDELFSPKFMQTCSKFKNIAELFEAGKINAKNTEEFNAIPKDILDKLVSENTTFRSWGSFDEAALRLYINNISGINFL